MRIRVSTILKKKVEISKCSTKFLKIFTFFWKVDGHPNVSTTEWAKGGVIWHVRKKHLSCYL